MKKPIIIAIILASSNLISAQSTSSNQIKAAQHYITLITEGEQEKAWQLFDKTNTPNLTKAQFDANFNYIRKSLDRFDTFALLTVMPQVVDKRTLNLYRFKEQESGQHLLADVFIDLIFIDTSDLVSGMRSFVQKKNVTSLSSSSKETSIEKQFTAVIENMSYDIRGINIVHLENNSGLLVIQIVRKISLDELQNDGWSKAEAVKFGKYLVSKGYVEKAKQKATELKLNFLEELGVSFVDTTTGKGINVPLKSQDFK